MSAFNDCRELEAMSRDHLQAQLIPEMVYDRRYVRIEKGPMAREFQASSGDYVWNSDNLTAWRVEHKCEYANTWGNLFLETFSNLSRGTLGWFFTNGADFLLYHFLRDGEVLLVRLADLRRWAWSPEKDGKPRIQRYAHRCQARYNQKNDTWGYCVRIADIEREVNVRRRAVEPLRIDAYEQRLDSERSARQ